MSPDLDGFALLVVDVQAGFADPSWGRRDNPACEANVARLVAAWREAGRPLVVVRHDSVERSSPLRPGQPGNDLLPEVEGPRDLLVTRSTNSALHGEPDLHAWLQAQGLTGVVFCGVTTNHCCETTARMAGDLAYRVLFVLDATSTFDRAGPDGVVVPAEELSRVTAANLQGEFADVVATQDVVEALGSLGATGRSSAAGRLRQLPSEVDDDG